jgi:hypothetical protein
MQLLYSGAEAPNKQQTDPNKSLGGYVSSSQIINGKLNNLFAPITKEDVKNNRTSTRLVVFKNDNSIKTNFKVFTTHTALATYQVAAVSPGLDSLSNPIFELIQDEQGIPYQATLSSCDTLPNALIIGTIAANTIIGIWIKRTLALENFTALDGIVDNDITCDELEDLLTSPSNSSIEEGQLIFDWS